MTAIDLIYADDLCNHITFTYFASGAEAKIDITDKILIVNQTLELIAIDHKVPLHGFYLCCIDLDLGIYFNRQFNTRLMHGVQIINPLQCLV